MTREDIIAMAREAGFADEQGTVHAAYQLERFAALVAAKERDKWMERVHILILGEREGCAKVGDAYTETIENEALGEFDKGWIASAKKIAAAIRARGESSDN